MRPSPSAPEFAVIGHPNEGKSSIVSTLAEDDSVRISPYPGETTECRSFPVVIDGEEVIRFTDTPGFQMPGKTLRWFRNYSGPADEAISSFLREHTKNDAFRDECELLSPIHHGAGIIYVADGSRPIRKNDLSEMEILKLTGRPGIAIVNCKQDDTRYIEEWRSALNSHFTYVALFNAHKATYSERIALLETLGRVDASWELPIKSVVDAFRKDWDARNTNVAELICRLVQTCVTHTATGSCASKAEKSDEKHRLKQQWYTDIEALEKTAHQKIRKLYKHNIFNIDLPAGSIASHDLFDSGTWRVLGLSKAQLAAAAATVSGGAAAAVDLALAGHSLGLFALAGGVAGAASVLIGADSIARTRIIGKRLGGYTLTVGPVKNSQLMFILIDRALIIYSHVINWSHGKRDRDHRPEHALSPAAEPWVTSTWDTGTKRIFNRLFSDLIKDDGNAERAMVQAARSLKTILDSIPV